jgi:hypothetical protein
LAQCDLGHDNAPGAAFCGVCGQQIVERDAQNAREGTGPQIPLQSQTGNPTQNLTGSAFGSTAGFGGGLNDTTAGLYPQVDPGAQKNKLAPWMFIVGGAGAVVLIALITFGVTRLAAPSTTVVTVTLAVYSDDFRGCNLGLGYFDVPGSTVIVRSDGEVVGTGSLGRFGTEELISCTFTARIENIPTNGSSYSFEIGRRGTGQATRAELEADDWTYKATLGL